MANKKILLVDDSNTVIMLHRMILSEYPYTLVIARNGKEAVHKAITEKPDLIFMDVVMPQMDGFTACRTLRDHPDFEKTPIVMVTTRGEPANVKQGYESGCTDYITKPFEAGELLQRLQRYLG